MTVELLVSDPGTLGAIEPLLPPERSLPVSTGSPALSVEISRRDSANPGTGVSRHPISEEHLDSHFEGPGLGCRGRGSPSPSTCGPPGTAASFSRPYAFQRGRPDATSTEQVGQAFPSHPTLLNLNKSFAIFETN